MDILECRREIDNIDEELVKLFEKRMNIAINVAKYKIENNMPIFNEAREIEVIKKNVARLSNKEYSKLTESFFNNLMTLSRSLQEEVFEESNYDIINKINDNISVNTNKKNLCHHSLARPAAAGPPSTNP